MRYVLSSNRSRKVRPLPDLIGRRVGRLVVQWPSVSVSARVQSVRYWACKCDCGGRKDIAESSLLDYSAKSCGCIGAATTHGMSHTREHSIWRGMLARCENPKTRHYRNYGGRGIKVCDRWQIFEHFYADMGPANGLTIDRIDGDGDYEPGNCRWATYQQQRENSRQPMMRVCIDGRWQTVSQWARELGVTGQCIRERANRGVYKFYWEAS